MEVLGLSLVACVALIVFRAVPPLVQLGERLVLLKEQEATTRNTTPKEEPIPSDIWMHCMKWGDEWAREDQLRRARDLYREHGDWDKVRTLVTVGE